jgi:hypothetical protein
MNPDYDQGGRNTTYTMATLGPSLGNVLLPVMPQTIISGSSCYTCQPFDSRLLIVGTCGAVYLPLCSSWMTAQGAGSLVKNLAGFDRSIWIKDLHHQTSSGNPFTVYPAVGSGDLIDGLPSIQLIEEGFCLRLYPLTDLSGWYTG